MKLLYSSKFKSKLFPYFFKERKLGHLKSLIFIITFLLLCKNWSEVTTRKEINVIYKVVLFHTLPSHP